MEKLSTKENFSIFLKQASVDDIPVLIDLEQSAANRHTYSPVLTEDEWKEEFRKNKVYLIEKENSVVGNISYERKDSDHAYISGLVVLPEFQGQGIARKALMQVLEELKDVKRIDLVTHPDNHVALQLYQSLGFTIESRKENYWGEGEPRLVLVKEK